MTLQSQTETVLVDLRRDCTERTDLIPPHLLATGESSSAKPTHKRFVSSRFVLPSHAEPCGQIGKQLASFASVQKPTCASSPLLWAQSIPLTWIIQRNAWVFCFWYQLVRVTACADLKRCDSAYIKRRSAANQLSRISSSTRLAITSW